MEWKGVRCLRGVEGVCWCGYLWVAVCMGDTAFVVVYSRDSKYSAYVVVAAVESTLRSVDVYMLRWDRDIDVVERVARLGNRYRRVVVGFPILTPQVLYVAHLVRLLRRYVPRAILVAGGPHATGDPLGTLTKLGFDVVVYGEGEDTVVEMLNEVDGGGDYRVCGTAYMDGDKLVVKKRSGCVDLDRYPPYPYWRELFCPIEIMRGCVSACRFCQVSYMFGRPRYRSIERVVEYAEIMWSRGLRDLRFIAPNSFAYGSADGIRPNVSTVLELLERLRSRASRYGGRIFFGSFPSEVRPDSVVEDLVRELRKLVDNKRVIIGAQSGSNRVLKAIHRGHTIEDVFEATEILLRYGFSVDIDFIFGLPGETREDIEATIKAMERLAMMGAKIHAHTFIPLPGTPFDSAPPGRVDPEVRKVVAKLIGLGKAYGEWIEQEKLAQMIHDLRAKRMVYTRREWASRARFLYC
ncbi:MAG TPA: TIGR04013 family B12-binding domain/radical SAM domain-containing protein [Ignisphaera aggregans]|uniref:TIGR04013 family B12-binding domain/radical SAM domain-containing protein n=1 Tax=Ignisphaera aggregans TaxID=334771 RepID=A0A832YY61_9CREN|nr:TIGR04013 family B12-binding domain/radical SAM domain-containing protein [Ignisphaera aggregans]